MRSQTTRVIAGRVNSDGSLASAGSGGYTARRVALGDYTVTFPGARVLGVSVSSAAGSAMFPAPIVLDAQNVRVIVYNSALAATDQAFTFTAAVAA